MEVPPWCECGGENGDGDSGEGVRGWGGRGGVGMDVDSLHR